MSAFDDSLSANNNQSPFGEAGLYGDPLHYAIGGNYDRFMRKTWEYPNEYIGKYLTKFDKFDRKINPIHRAIDRTAIGGKIAGYVHNKPGDSALAVLGTIFGGGALMGGGSAGAGGGTGEGLGVFSNNGAGGMSQVGGSPLGNAINSGSFTPMSGASGPMSGMSQMRLPQQQQQQPKNTWLADELERQQKEQELKKQIAAQMGPQYV